ncbi:unnamed protein product [Clonostachys rosea]|uniref:Uncharacterized protein n=1 Tax=Bionectria ochroleuca TaxID=29856 RepID=A0ABY6UST8_BIOOC|nr:unnamed protein product [Clonostachys rosea]
MVEQGVGTRHNNRVEDEQRKRMKLSPGRNDAGSSSCQNEGCFFGKDVFGIGFATEEQLGMSWFNGATSSETKSVKRFKEVVAFFDAKLVKGQSHATMSADSNGTDSKMKYVGCVDHSLDE